MTSSDRSPTLSPDDAAAETLRQIARERDHAHRALEEREAELARIQRIGRVGGVEVDLQNGIRNRRSPEYLIIHGLSPEAVNETHEDWVKRIHPDDRERTERQFLAALSGREEDYSSEYRIIRPNDDQIRWIAVTAKIDRDSNGRAIRLVGAHIDITDRMVAQETLRESEERFRLIANSAPVPIWVTKLDRTRSFANQAYLDFLGLPFEEAVVFDWRKALYPEDLPRILKEQVEGESSLKPFVLEARYKRADGEWRWLRSESQPRWDPTGEHVGFIGVAHDITAAKQAELELRQINETLERRIEERTAQLLKGEEALRQSQKMEAIGQLTGGVAHDFNNLLTIIRSATDFLRRRELPEERRRRYIDAISETVERASKLTAQLLAFARRQPLKPQVFNVGTQVENVVQLIQPLVGNRIRIDVEIDSPNYFAVADIAQFETALINLAVNGRDAMEGEGHMGIEVKKVFSIPELRGASNRNGEFIAVSVKDTGTGIPADKHEAIFEPFFTTKEVGRGTGLGLSQAFGFAKQSEGDIEVISTVGEGTTLIIYLPQAAIPVERSAVAAVGGDAVTSGRGYRVLVVEDNEDVGQFSTELLKDLGYIIHWARSADEALTVLAEDEFAVDLVFSDVIMPGMNGVELAGVIRGRYPGLPVVLTSGYSNVLAENADRGFDLIQKPYSVESLSPDIAQSDFWKEIRGSVGRSRMKSAFLLSLGLALTVCNSAIAESARPAEMISKYRLQHGEGRVTLDTSLNRVAQDQANAMAAKDLLDHSALGPFNSRVASLGSTYAAENIAFGYSDFPRTLDQWIESSGHRKNLLMHDASRVGVASAKSSTTGRTYWAMVIAGGYKNPKSSAPAKRQAVRTCRVSILGICL